MQQLLSNDKTLIRHIIRVLNDQAGQNSVFPDQSVDRAAAAGVLLLLGPRKNKKNNRVEPCLILNKRSQKVRQPGDLCFPGGSITPGLDSSLAKLFSLPITSLGRWPYWPQWKRTHPQAARLLALLWATGLRESLEEMRLNPFGARILGPMPPQSLVMFQRKIYPIVTWIKRQKRFYPNWEVEKILYIPLRELLEPANYRRYRLRMKIAAAGEPAPLTRDYLCFRFKNKTDNEILWGATFRITSIFMEYVFEFKPPRLEDLPVVEGNLDRTYLTGQN